MNKFITNRKLALINFAIVFYFILIYLLNYFKIDFVLIGFFRELLTIPFFIAQIIFVIISVKYLRKHQIQLLTLISCILLVISTVIIIGSFF